MQEPVLEAKPAESSWFNMPVQLSLSDKHKSAVAASEPSHTKPENMQDNQEQSQGFGWIGNPMANLASLAPAVPFLASKPGEKNLFCCLQTAKKL